MKTHLAMCALVLALFGTTPMTAQAITLIDSWTIDLEGIPGMEGYGQITDIDEFEYLGISHSVLNDTNGNFTPEVGEVYEVDGVLVMTNLTGGGFPRPLTTTGKVLNLDFEITMVYQVSDEILYIDFTTGTTELIHLGATAERGQFHIFVDTLDGTGNPATNPNRANTELNPGNGSGGGGMQDGVLVASFDVQTGDGGMIDAFMGVDGVYPNLDGFDDATFDFVSGLSGVLFDEHGNDMTLGELGDQLIAIRDLSYDFDPDNNDIVDSGPPAGWAITGFENQGGGGSHLDFYALFDGSSVLASNVVVPEPGTLTLLGASILCLLFHTCRRRRRQAA